ncbi:MAG: hypothetical protein ACFCU6_04495 [Balneolaceae bacterium]
MNRRFLTGLSVKFIVTVCVFISIAVTVSAQEARKDTVYLHELIERDFDITRDRVTMDYMLRDFDTMDYSVYYFRRSVEINLELYEMIKRVTLRSRDRIKLKDQIFFTINNEYIPGFMQLYTLPVTKLPEDPDKVYEDN